MRRVHGGNPARRAKRSAVGTSEQLTEKEEENLRKWKEQFLEEEKALKSI